MLGKDVNKNKVAHFLWPTLYISSCVKCQTVVVALGAFFAFWNSAEIYFGLDLDIS